MAVIKRSMTGAELEAKTQAITASAESIGAQLRANAGVLHNVPRDFDKEARGKTFCQYLSAVLSNPSVNVATVDELFPLIDKCVARTFGDK